MKDHKDYWNIKAAHEFWCEHGNKTLCGRKFAWCESWLIDAMDEVRAEVLDLEDASQRINRIRATQRNAFRHVSFQDSSPDQKIYTKKIASSETTESDTEIYSPSHKPVFRPFDPYEPTEDIRSPRPGSQAHPIMIIQDSEDEGGDGDGDGDGNNDGDDDSDGNGGNDNSERRYSNVTSKAKSMRREHAQLLKRFSTIHNRENRGTESKCEDENPEPCQSNNLNPSTPIKEHPPNSKWALRVSTG